MFANFQNEYLVNWAPSWIAEKDVTPDLIEEFEKNNKAEGDSFSMFQVKFTKM